MKHDCSSLLNNLSTRNKRNIKLNIEKTNRKAADKEAPDRKERKQIYV